MTEGRKFPSRVQTFLWHCAAWRHITFPAVAAQAAELFGEFAPTVDDIANFVCSVFHGKASLCRFRRDTQVVEWLFEHGREGTIRQVREKCVARWGALRTPSMSALGDFMHRVGLSRPHRKKSLAFADPQYAAWLFETARNLPLGALHAASLLRWGPERTLSKSAIQRHLARAGIKSAGRVFWSDAYPKVADFIRECVGRMTLRQMRDAAVAKFPGCYVPSVSIIHRLVASLPVRAVRRRGRLDAAPEIAQWVRENRTLLTLTDLHKEGVRLFGDRMPSRSAIHRYLSAIGAGRRVRRGTAPAR